MYLELSNERLIASIDDQLMFCGSSENFREERHGQGFQNDETDVADARLALKKRKHFVRGARTRSRSHDGLHVLIGENGDEGASCGLTFDSETLRCVWWIRDLGPDGLAEPRQCARHGTRASKVSNSIRHGALDGEEELERLSDQFD